MEYSTITPEELIQSSEYATPIPRYLKGREVQAGLTQIHDDENNWVYYIPDFFQSEESTRKALDGVCSVKRPIGQSTAFGYKKPREEMGFHCSSASDSFFKYGGKKNPSLPASEFDLELSQMILDHIRVNLGEIVKSEFDPSKLQADQGVNVHYSPNHVGGGSVGDHGDTHPDYVWPVVAIITFGQRRTFHIKGVGDKMKGKPTYYLQPKHGSLLVMIGSDFQYNWRHGVPKITEVKHSVSKPPIGHRVSWNIRYKINE